MLVGGGASPCVDRRSVGVITQPCRRPEARRLQYRGWLTICTSSVLPAIDFLFEHGAYPTLYRVREVVVAKPTVSEVIGSNTMNTQIIPNAAAFLGEWVQDILMIKAETTQRRLLTRRQWAHRRLRWAERRARNTRVRTAPGMQINYSVRLRLLLLPRVGCPLEDLRTNQQECGDFAIPWHPFSLSGRWAGFQHAFNHETRRAQRVEIRAEHAVIVRNPATDSVRVR